MSTETEDRLQRRSLQKEYGNFYRSVSDILFRHNLLDLDGHHNTGGYDQEVDLLLLRIREAETPQSLHGLLYEVFANSFGETSCGTRDRFGGAAAEIWKTYEKFKAGK